MSQHYHAYGLLCVILAVLWGLGCQPTGLIGDELTPNGGSSTDDSGISSSNTADNTDSQATDNASSDNEDEDSDTTDPGIPSDSNPISVDPDDGWNGSQTEASHSSSNIAPIALDQNTTVTAGQPLEITLVGTDEDEGPASLSYRVIAGPAYGSLTGTPPVVIYTATASYIGTDTFTFQVGDGADASNVATVSITVRPDFAHLTGVYRITEIIDADGNTDYPQPGVDDFGRWEIRDSQLYGWWSIGEVNPGDEPFFVRLDTSEPQEVTSGGVTYTITVTSITQSIDPETRVFSATYEELVTDSRSNHTEKFILTGTIAEDAQTIVGTATFAYAGKTVLNHRPVIFERMSDADADVEPLPNTTRNMSIFCGQGTTLAAPLTLLAMLPFTSIGRRYRSRLLS